MGDILFEIDRREGRCQGRERNISHIARLEELL